MKLPYTNQINQQLPIFQVIGSYWLLSNCIKSMYATAEISEPHRTRAKQGAGSCKWASTQTLFQLHYGPPWPTMAYHGLPWSTKIHGFNLYFKSVSSMFILHPWCTLLAFPSFKLHELWTIPTVPKNNTALPALLLEEVEAFQQCHGSWQFTFPSSQLVQKTICIRWESKHSFVLFKFEARTLWQPSERFPIRFWLQTEATAEPLPNSVAPEPKSPPPSVTNQFSIVHSCSFILHMFIELWICHATCGMHHSLTVLQWLQWQPGFQGHSSHFNTVTWMTSLGWSADCRLCWTLWPGLRVDLSAKKKTLLCKSSPLFTTSLWVKDPKLANGDAAVALFSLWSTKNPRPQSKAAYICSEINGVVDAVANPSAKHYHQRALRSQKGKHWSQQQ